MFELGFLVSTLSNRIVGHGKLRLWSIDYLKTESNDDRGGGFNEGIAPKSSVQQSIESL